MKRTLLAADYSALEVVILADLTLRLFGDDTLAKAVTPGGPDIHSENVRKIFGEYLRWTIPSTWSQGGEPVPCPYAGQTVDKIPVGEVKKHPYGSFLRESVKVVFYGWAYGKRGYGFATLSDGKGGMIGEDVANKMVNGLLSAMPALGRLESWVQSYVDANHGIYSLDGRWCDLSLEMAGDEWRHKRAYRRALNFPCQATAAGIIGDALIRVTNCPKLKALGYRVILQVHDELVLEGSLDNVEVAGNLVKGHMEDATANGVRLMVPLQASIGHGSNYWEAK